MKTGTCLLLAVVLAAFCVPVVAAHGEDSGHEIQDQAITGTGKVESGSFLEVDLEMEAGAVLSYVIDAGAEVNVNLHEHEVDTVYHAQHNKTRTVTEEFVVPQDGIYSLMIVGISGSDPARVELVLEGPFALIGNQGFTFGEEEAPGPALPFLIVGVLVWFALARRH